MNTLAIRKRLLIAESELNRIQLVGEIRALKAEVRALASGATLWRSMVSSAAVMTLNLASFPHGQAAATGARPCRSQILLKGAAQMVSLWMASRMRVRSRDF
jgi:hypothetical protein